MNNENYISEEAFEELVNGLEFVESFTLYGRKSLKYHIKRLQKENEQLKKELEQSNAVADTNKELAESFHKEKQQLKQQLKKLKKITKQFLIYLDKNKSVLNNPNILDFYINIKEILKMDQGE